MFCPTTYDFLLDIIPYNSFVYNRIPIKYDFVLSIRKNDNPGYNLLVYYAEYRCKIKSVICIKILKSAYKEYYFAKEGPYMSTVGDYPVRP